MINDISEKEHAETMRREFSANVSHELKTPLTSIIGYAEMMENGLIKIDDISTCACKIRSESERLMQMVEDILLLSRLDEQAINFFSETVDVFTILSQIQKDLYLKTKEVPVKINIACTQKALVQGNMQLIYELFYNLIDNAIKYNKPNGEINISIDTKDQEAIISIQDTGIGINEKETESIFERFYCIDKSRSKKTGGTGLGLAIVKHIVQVHKGHIDVKSQENVGTTITIFLQLSSTTIKSK